MDKIKKEEVRYLSLPKIYDFGSQRNKEIMLNQNFRKVNKDIDNMILDLGGKGEPKE